MFKKKPIDMNRFLRLIGRSLDDFSSGEDKSMYEIRRSLLGCGYYEDDSIKRFFYRVRMHRSSLVSFALISSLVVFGGVFVGFGFVSRDDIVDTHVSILKSYNQSEYFQALYNHGYIQYDHQTVEGDRVYLTRDIAREITIIDRQPYKIHMVLSN